MTLLWSDLNVEYRTSSVSKQTGWSGEGELEICRRKRETSIRKVSIPQVAINLLIEEHSKRPNNLYLFSTNTLSCGMDIETLSTTLAM